MYVQYVASLVFADTSRNVPARTHHIISLSKCYDRKGCKLWNNSVEGTAFKTKALLVCAETTEILCNEQNIIIFRAYFHNHSCAFVMYLYSVDVMHVRDGWMHALPHLHVRIVVMH